MGNSHEIVMGKQHEVVMGNIGEEQHEIEMEPLEEPATVPIEAPAEPERVPVPVGPSTE